MLPGSSARGSARSATRKVPGPPQRRRASATMAGLRSTPTTSAPWDSSHSHWAPTRSRRRAPWPRPADGGTSERRAGRSSHPLNGPVVGRGRPHRGQPVVGLGGSGARAELCLRPVPVHPGLPTTGTRADAKSGAAAAGRPASTGGAAAGRRPAAQRTESRSRRARASTSWRARSTSTVRHCPDGHHRHAGHPHVGDQPAGGRPHQVLDHLGLVQQGHERRVVESHRHHVGRDAGRQHPEVGPPEGPSGSPGGQVQGGGGRKGGGIPLADPGQHGGQPHLLPQVEVVVGGRTVGPQPHPDPPGQQLDQRRHPRGQLGVALRAVGHGHVELPVEVDVGLGQPDAVGGQHPTVQHPGRGQDGRRRVPVLVGEAAALLLGLGQVDVEQGVELPSRLGDVDQPRQRHGVGGVRGEPDLDAAVVTVPAAVEVDDLVGPPHPPLLDRGPDRAAAAPPG